MKRNAPKEKREDERAFEDEKKDEHILALEKKAAERDLYYDKYVRAVAEYDNARKRMQKQLEDHVKYANEGLITELFPVLDSFDSAIGALDKTETAVTICEGLKMLESKFHKILEAHGLAVMRCVGERFDPSKHEAVMRVHTKDFEDGSIVEEMRKGYLLNGKVLRPAMVKVALHDDPDAPASESSERPGTDGKENEPFAGEEPANGDAEENNGEVTGNGSER